MEAKEQIKKFVFDTSSGNRINSEISERLEILIPEVIWFFTLYLLPIQAMSTTCLTLIRIKKKMFFKINFSIRQT